MAENYQGTYPPIHFEDEKPLNKNYIDNDGNKLEKGFYTSPLVYFTGNYREDGVPIFDNENNTITELFNMSTKKLTRLTQEEVKRLITESKAKTNWLEEGLKFQ